MDSFLDIIKNTSVKCKTDIEVVIEICVGEGISIYRFMHDVDKLDKNIKYGSPVTKNVCIPLKNGKHTTLRNLYYTAHDVYDVYKLQTNTTYDMLIKYGMLIN